MHPDDESTDYGIPDDLFDVNTDAFEEDHDGAIDQEISKEVEYDNIYAEGDPNHGPNDDSDTAQAEATHVGDDPMQSEGSGESQGDGDGDNSGDSEQDGGDEGDDESGKGEDGESDAEGDKDGDGDNSDDGDGEGEDEKNQPAPLAYDRTGQPMFAGDYVKSHANCWIDNKEESEWTGKILGKAENADGRQATGPTGDSVLLVIQRKDKPEVGGFYAHDEDGEKVRGWGAGANLTEKLMNEDAKKNQKKDSKVDPKLIPQLILDLTPKNPAERAAFQVPPEDAHKLVKGDAIYACDVCAENYGPGAIYYHPHAPKDFWNGKGLFGEVFGKKIHR